MTSTQLVDQAETTLFHSQLLRDYASYLGAAGYATNLESLDPVLWGARAFLRHFPHLKEWLSLPLPDQLRGPRKSRYFLHYLFLRHLLPASAAYLISARPNLGKVARRYLERETFAQYMEVGRRLHYSVDILSQQFHALACVMAYSQKELKELTIGDMDAFTNAVHVAWIEAGYGSDPRYWHGRLFGVRTVLFHMGVLPNLARRRTKGLTSRQDLWRGVSSTAIRTTAWRYLDQIALVRRPGTVINHEHALRRFFTWLAESAPEISRIAQVQRRHIEGFKEHLRTVSCLPGAHRPPGARLHAKTAAVALGCLRCFFLQITEWGWEEVPPRPLIFDGDFPIRETPLPRFLDDAQASALLRTAQASPDLFTRVCVEMLLRTGLRKGEFTDITADSVIQLGSAYWLRVPVGKLHTDRYIPLHPVVKSLLDEWFAYTQPQHPWDYLFTDHGRRISPGRVDDVVCRVASASGIREKVSPHRLRHTLATQAINRGMSLESIANLLGHRSLTMTLVYARIANRTVQKEYFAVSEQLERLYKQPQPDVFDDGLRTFPAVVEGPQMRRLRQEHQWRMLGNGYGTRSEGVTCDFETICESCACFLTTADFLPTLEKQREDADAKGQSRRVEVFRRLILSLEPAP